VKQLLIAAAALVLTPAGAVAADLSGVWQVHGVFNGVITYTTVCTLKQSGANLAGPCIDHTNNTNAQAKGAVNGGAVEFGYDTNFKGLAVRLDYKGALQPNGTLKGVIATAGAQGAFTANRRRTTHQGQVSAMNGQFQ
jgi:hypothetical protein